MDMMIHDFDMVRYLSGSDVTEVSATGALLVDPRFADYDDVDTAIVTLKFANGAIGVIDNCRQAPLRLRSESGSTLREGLRAGQQRPGECGLCQHQRRG